MRASWHRWYIIIAFALICSFSFGLTTVSILGLLFWIWFICSFGQNFDTKNDSGGNKQVTNDDETKRN